MLRSTILFCTIILFGSCGSGLPTVAIMNAKDCSIASFEKNFYVSEITLFSNEESINKKQIRLSDIERSSNKINFCNLIESHKIDIKKINLIAVCMNNAKNDMRHFVINSDQLSLIGKDTSFLFSEPIQ